VSTLRLLLAYFSRLFSDSFSDTFCRLESKFSFVAIESYFNTDENRQGEADTHLSDGSVLDTTKIGRE
jgi:hypothetical protein